jgi:hypothetical protein
MSNAIATFGREAAAEVGYYLDRRICSMQWRSYGDERAWHTAASEYEAQLATFRATAPVSVVEIHGRRVRTMKPIRAVAAAALLVLGLASVMAGSAQAASPDVQHAEGVAATLPAAASPQAAEANQAALAPAVKATVAAGHGRELLDSTTSPDVRADLLRYGGVTKATIGSPPSRYAPPAQAARHKRAHAAGCYGSPWTQERWTEFGQTVAWIFVRENGWCGSGGRITWLGGPTFADWSWGPFCLGGVGTNYSWDGSVAWVHMAIWGSLGNSYPWGCFTWSGAKIVQRIAWTGYWDRYNDYGF